MSSPENNELSALIRMIDEPDNRNFTQIRDKIISFGTGAISALEDTWENSFNNDIQQRIEDIIHNIQFKDVALALRHWVKHEEHDLMKGFYLVSRYQYPDLIFDGIEKQVGKLVQDIWLEINDNLTALEKVKVINHIMFEEQGFLGNKTNIHAPGNYFINTVLETRKGSHVSLSVIYILICRSLNIPVYGINLPQHFIVAYTDDLFKSNERDPGSDDVLFYINPLNKGSIFTRTEIDTFIDQLKLEPDDSYYTPCSNKTIIRRILNDLMHLYDRLAYIDKKEELAYLMKCLGD